MERGWVASLLVTGAIASAAWVNISESRAAPETATVTLCYEDVDVRPWHYRRGGGLDFQLLDRAGKRAGASFQYEARPWQACLAKLRANQVDGVFGEDFDAKSMPDDGPTHEVGYRLRKDGESASYLVFAQEFSNRRPELAGRIRESVETARASAAYQILERQTLSMLGKG